MITSEIVQAAIDRLASLRCNRGPRCRPGFTYVIRSPALGLIKIGMSFDPVKRLTEIQAMNADRLTLETIVHGSWLELALHEALTDERRHSEWFASENPIPYTTGDACYGCLATKNGERLVLDLGRQRTLL